MVDQQGRDALLAVLSGLTEHHEMSLVHITHYNDEADSADRVVNLTGNGGDATTSTWWRRPRRPPPRPTPATTTARPCSN